jgi:shikimate dehydrogenase
LIFKDGRISGSNTDGWGFIANVRHHGIDPLPDSALLLGAGGSTRAIAAALQAVGVSVTIANRTRERAVRLAADLPGIRVVEWAARSEALADHGMLVNTTSLGMAGHGPVEIALDRARPDLVVADIVYVPMETGLLATARARGLRCVGGLGLLLFQAIPGFRAWFGVEPSVDADLERFVAADLMPK